MSFSEMEIQIEPANIKDADAAAKLTFMAYHKFSYDIFGNIGEHAATENFKQLWLHGDNRFGCHYSYIAKVNGEVIGLMTCYKAGLIKKLVAPTLWQLLRIGKFNFVRHFITNIRNFYYFAKSDDILPDEFYVATLAVTPEYRGQGVGAEMLRYAHKLAQKADLGRCTLHVSAENKSGIRFYERNGFKKVEPKSAKPTYFRMVYSPNHVIV